MITQSFNLNLIPDSAPVVVHVDQYDVGEGRFVIKLMNGDTPYTPVGATAVIQGMKPDGHGFIYAATISGNTVTADLVEQMSIVAGNVRCQLVITDADDRTGTFVFIIAVQKSALPADSDMSTSDYQLVENLIITAESINTNPPKIGVNGNWWIWDVSTMQYVDSGVDASITVNIADITMLSPDAAPYVTNSGTNTDPVFHLFIPRGQTGATGPAAGFGTPTASVDANVGTPSVSISASGPDTAKVFDFQFHNLKGATGNTGATGAAAGFGTITASVDANTGTPSVSVTASGPDTAKVLDFQFHNLKGETGTDANAVHWDERKGYVGKNLLQNKLNNGSNSSLTWKVNIDKSVLLTGTPTQNVNIIINDFVLPAGTYKISDGATGQSGSTFKMAVWTNVGGQYVEYLADTMGYKGDTFTLNSDTLIGVMFTIYSGFNTNNKVVYPMLRFASISDGTYEPYLVPNTDLLSYTENSVLGAKNFMVQPYADPVTFSRGGITYTISEDGSIDVHGLATAEGQIDLHTNVKTPLTNLQTNTEYILSGAPAISNSTNDVRLQIILKDNSTGRIDVICPQGGEVHFVIPTGYHFHWSSIYVRNGQNLNHALFKPMIRLASDTDATYKPYAMPNRDLTLKNTFYLLNSTNDLDDYVTDGQYYYESDRPAHAPDTGNTTWAKVFVIGEGTPLQIAVSGSAMYTRRKGGGGNTWGNWYKYAGTSLT